MAHKKVKYLPAIAIGMIIGMILIFPVASLVQAGSEGIYKQVEEFTESLILIREHYVDEVEIKDLIYGAIKGMTLALDPHSQFMEPEQYKDMKVETEGEFGGIGIEITIKDNVLTIVSPIHDTPGSRAGLMTDDKITRIDGDTTKDITIYEAVKKMRGKPGTDVKLTVYREIENKILHFDLTRAIIQVKSINTAVMLTRDIAYVYISQFQEKTSRELKAALKDLKSKGMKALVLDLRYNPGGLLDMAVKVASEFLKKDDLVVYTKGRLVGQNMQFRVKASRNGNDYPLVVMINRGSASASEIVAGAMQDHKRGILLGSKSFGKGSVQTVIPLRGGAAIKLTTAKYYTPADRMIHGTGIVPDIVVNLSSEEEIDFLKNRREIMAGLSEKYKSPPEEESQKEESDSSSSDEELSEDNETKPESGGDSNPKNPSSKEMEEIEDMMGHSEDESEEEKNLEDKQLDRAVDLLKGILFYGPKQSEAKLLDLKSSLSSTRFL
ncbi:S41 family peptidase [PVC group bacterium]|nr:S41 family peptidase [PVC group bacterium]